MKIEITSKEYRDLLDVLHLADVVMSGHGREEDKRMVRHRALIQKLYALAQGEGLAGLITYDPRTSAYVPTRDFEESTPSHDVVDAFGDHLFWDELITRLSERDTAQMAGGADRLHGLSEKDRAQMEQPIRQRYIDEFTANGVANLEIVQRFDTGWEKPVKTSD